MSEFAPIQHVDQALGVSSRKTLTRVLTLAIVLLAFAIRLFHLGAMGFEFDEAFSVYAAFQSFAGIIHLLTTGEPHPPFYYSLLHFWYPFVGTTEFAIRFPSVVANILTIVLLVKIADWFGWTLAGRMSGLIVALNPWQIWYAQEARMYTPVALFSAGAVYFALRSLRGGRRRDLAWYGVFLLLALGTHYYAILLAISLNLIVFFHLRFAPPGPVRWRTWLALQAVIAVIYLPWLAFAYRISLYYVRAAPSSVDLPGVVRNALTYYSLGRSLPPSLEAELSLGFLVVLLVGFYASSRSRIANPGHFGTVFLAAYMLGPMSMGFVISHFRSLFIPQYFFVSSPAFFLGLGLGVAWLIKRAWPVGIVAAGVLLGTQLVSVQNYFFNPTYDKAEVVNAINYVESYRRPGDGFILDGPGQDTQFWFYHSIRWKDPSPSLVFPLAGFAGWASTPDAINAFMARQAGAWFLDYGVEEDDAQHVVQSYLSRNYYQAVYEPIGANRVLYFASPPRSAPKITTLNLTCNDDVSLLDLSSFGTSVPAGGIVPLDLRWKALKNAPGDYVASWRLIDSAGHVIVQRDSQPASGFSPTSNWSAGQIVDDRYGLVIPSYALPGDYQLVAQVYNRSNGNLCVPARSGTPLPGIQVPLTTIQVTNAVPLPALSPPQPRHLVDENFGPLRLVGYDLAPGPYHPGDAVSVRLYWADEGKVSLPLSVSGKLAGPDNKLLANDIVPIASAPSRHSSLVRGEVLVSYLDLRVPPTASSSTAAVELALTDGRTTRQLLTSSPTIGIVSRPRTFTRPPVSHPLSANLGGKAELIGYDLASASTTFAPNQTLKLTLYWHATATFSASQKVFTHLVGPKGQIFGQSDSIPLSGTAPTTSWAPGEFLIDHYEIAVSPGVPVGTYTLQVGMYDPNTGARLPVNGGGGDVVVLARLAVGPIGASD